MNNEERDLISKFVARVSGAPQGGFGSVPSTRPNLPPIDPEADNFIAQEFQKYPEARYRITQMAVVQEAALVEAQNRIQQLQFQLQQAQQQLQQAQQQKPASSGFLGALVEASVLSRPSRSRLLRVGVEIRVPCRRRSINRCRMVCSQACSSAGAAGSLGPR